MIDFHTHLHFPLVFGLRLYRHAHFQLAVGGHRRVDMAFFDLGDGRRRVVRIRTTVKSDLRAVRPYVLFGIFQFECSFMLSSKIPAYLQSTQLPAPIRLYGVLSIKTQLLATTPLEILDAFTILLPNESPTKLF